jgi:hypothetical protein
MAGLPVSVNLTAYRGDTWSQEFRLLRGEAPVDLTGATVAAEARSDAGARYDLDAAITNAAGGIIVISFPAIHPPAGSYVYDVEVVDGTDVTTWVNGRITIVRDVTNEQS